MIQNITKKIYYNNKNSERVLLFYNLYRFLQTLLLIIYFLSNKSSRLGQDNPTFFLFCTGAYGMLCLAALVQSMVPGLKPLKEGAVLGIFFTDIIAIVLLIHFSGGIYSTLSILLIVVVATSTLLLRGIAVFFIAACASISLLAEQFYIFLQSNASSDNFALTGALGIALFCVAFVGQQLANRLRDSEETVYQQAKEVKNLQKFNSQIIERMPNGVIVVDSNLYIEFMNTSAWRLLNKPDDTNNRALREISESLQRQTYAWRNNPNSKTETFSESHSASTNKTILHAHFAHLDDTEENNNTGTLIFIEDASLVASRAQKMKLVSLGTLTAGIAHEIRNPLGAISHAAQLLAESSELNEADIRLSDIIQQHSVRMNRIIENVLQLSRQKVGNLKDIDIKLWLRDFVTEFRASQAHTIDLELDLGSDIHLLKEVDSSQLSQVLTNLCENGIRYSHAKTGIYYIRIVCDFDLENRHHYIDIIDKGPGISQDNAEHLFEPFFTTDTKGSGLGLYIAKELCENNRSTLRFKPTPDNKSCFRINFSS